MTYIFMGFCLCIGVVAYASIGLLFLAVLPFELFRTIATMGDTEDYWRAIWLWPIYLVVNFLLWCITKIDKFMEE